MLRALWTLGGLLWRERKLRQRVVDLVAEVELLRRENQRLHTHIELINKGCA